MGSQPTRLSSLSIFLPCFNEAKNIPLMVAALKKVAPQITNRYEIIIIDDGSHDRTGQIAKDMSKKDDHIRVIHHPTNLGYGLALRSGYQAARYDWTFFTDADNQFDVTELTKFIPFSQDYSVIIGYRKRRADGGLRLLNAQIYKLFIDILFRLHVKDIDCAFKLIRTDVIQKINFISTGAMISAELLYRLKKMHQPFKQISVSHYPRRFGNPTGNSPKVILKAGWEAMKLYLFMKFGWHLTS